MLSPLARVGAVSLALGMLTLIVGHAALSGCRSPESVATPSALPTTEREAAKSSSAPSEPLGKIGAVSEAKGAAATAVKPAPSVPVFFGASKAAPVFRGDQMGELNAPTQAAQTPTKPSMSR